MSPLDQKHRVLCVILDCEEIGHVALMHRNMIVPKLRAAELAITMMTTTTMVMLMTRIMTSINSQHATHHWWQGSWPNMRPTWSRQDPGGPMLAPWTLLSGIIGLTRQPMWVSRMFHVAGVLRQPMPYTRNANIIEPNVWSPKAYVWPLD